MKTRVADYGLYVRSLKYVVYGGLILYFGRDIFIPLSFAVLISFVIYPPCNWLEKRGFKRMTAILINISLLLLGGALIFGLLINQAIGFVKEWPAIEGKATAAFNNILEYVTQSYGISRERQAAWISQLFGQSGGNAFSLLTQMISASVFSTILMVLIPVYAVLILYYREQWVKVLFRLFPSERKQTINKILSLTIRAYYNFIKGMGLVYLIVGMLNSLGLLLLGVPHAILFGFIAAILTFIPYIGIIVGSLLPITMAWITYDSPWYPAGVVAIFAFVQYLEANIIFPIAVSNRLNVNTLVMLLAIFTGGIIWGMAGMILFVPFVGIIKLIADQNPKLRTLSLILGAESSSQTK